MYKNYLPCFLFMHGCSMGGGGGKGEIFQAYGAHSQIFQFIWIYANILDNRRPNCIPLWNFGGGRERLVWPSGQSPWLQTWWGSCY